MSVFDDLPLGPSKKTEPAWHPAVKRSFLFVPTAGMRVAPEVLVLELYREIFYSQRSKELSAREIKPDGLVSTATGLEPAFSEIERAVLYASRGRRKQNKQSRDDNFYTPAFPSLARHAWLRRKSDRVIKDFLFRALSQKIHGHGKGAEAKISTAVSLIYSALVGNNTVANPDHKNLELIGLELDSLQDCVDNASSVEKLRQHLGESSSTDADGSSYKSVFKTVNQDDPLASRIYDDFLTLCRLEPNLDRLQWLDLLKCFLRLATSTWLLAHMRLTVMSRNTLLGTLQGQDDPRDSDWLASEIRNRALNLLRPSITPTSQIHDHVDSYMRARVELNLLVAVVEKYSGEDFQDKTFTVVPGGSGNMPLEELIIKAQNVREQVSVDVGGSSIRAMLTRKCEKYKAWVAPRKKGYGQGKNYAEFLRVLRYMTKGDEDGGYLLIQQGNGFIVFPGQLMLKLVAFLSGRRVTDRGLVLADLESHFSEYGIDFGAAAGARPRLISTMQEIGMLKGSPDAGDSVGIDRPYG